MRTKIRKTCRVCDSPEIATVLNLGNFYLSSFVDDRNENIGRAPLELVECKDCSLVQLKHTAPVELMYSNQYWYKSGVNKVIRDDLKEIVRVAIELAKPKKGDAFMDLGANDGTLLSYVPKKFYRLGIEPAKNFIKELRQHCDKAICGFWGEGGKVNIPENKKAKIITAIGMFYDSENPNAFIKDCRDFLHEDGLFIAQMMTLQAMLDKNDVGNICHEHLEFYTYESLIRLFEQNGLEIFKVEKNTINGGSYRIFARHYKKGSVKLKEKTPDFTKYKKQIEQNKTQLVAFIEKALKSGKKVFAYGASTKGNLMLQYYGLDYRHITAIADANPAKIGKFTAGTKIPIVSEEEARKHADYFFILPYAFTDFFLKRESAWRKKGGKFIVSTPKFKIL